MGPFTSVVRCDGYNYILDIDELSADVVSEAEKSFHVARGKGFIIADSFWANTWLLIDEAKNTKTVNFTINQINFHRICAPLLGCSAKEYETTMRVAVTCYFGAATAMLQGYCHALCRMANKMQIDGSTDIVSGYEQAIQKFLSLLPGESAYRDDLIHRMNQAVTERTRQEKEKTKTSRPLCYYQSYLRFDKVITDFWGKASEKDKVLYFPIYLWWTLTGTLPLRPSEFTLIPRNCLSWKNGKAYLTIRRTKVKGKYLSCEYRIDADYVKETYCIPLEIAAEIESYIRATKPVYNSEIDTLFCKETQFSLARAGKVIVPKYLYNNLNKLLELFYENVVLSPEYEYHLRDKCETPLNEGEIEKINLGDTRHIAMISLMLSGKSELICQALAGHDIIETGQAYYGNVKTFVDAIVWERVRMPKQTVNRDYVLPSKYTRVEGGLCFSDRTCVNDFSDCECAVSEDGEIGCCRSCSFFRPIAGKKTDVSAKDERLKTAFLHVLDAISKAKKGLSTTDEITAAAMKLQSEVTHYTTQAAVAFVENGGNRNGK